jgi:hypothetical protein
MTDTTTDLPGRPALTRRKDATAALRARRARRKRKAMRSTMVPSVTARIATEDIPAATSTVTPPLKSWEFPGRRDHPERHGDMSGLGNPGDDRGNLGVGRSIAIRNAARDAASLVGPESGYVARLLRPVEPGLGQPVVEKTPTSAPMGAPTWVGSMSRPQNSARPWSAIGRAGVGLAIVSTGAFIAYTSMRANSWFGHSLTRDPVAGEVYSHLSVAAEVIACLLPTGIRFYAQEGEWWTALRGWVLMAVALVVVFFAAGGFADQPQRRG